MRNVKGFNESIFFSPASKCRMTDTCFSSFSDLPWAGFMLIKELKNGAQIMKEIKSHAKEGFHQVFACVEMRVCISWFSGLSFH